MDFNLPIADPLHGCRNLLVTGIGGGFDVYCGLPIYLELRRRGFGVHLANYSFSDISGHRHGTRLSPTLVGVRADHDDFYPYFPEFHLTRWLREHLGEDIPIWSFEKTGCRTLAADYRTLVDHLGIDGVVMVDGGVDSLMRGDEAETGTIVEDAISMAAIRALPGLKARVLGCVGLGAERDVNHAHVFENIAAITRDGGFLGTCSLTRQMPVAQRYLEALAHAQSQRFQDPSVINSSIASALQGEFGDFHLTAKTRGSRLWISPLMPIYWFFDFEAVARRSLILDTVDGTATFREAVMAVVNRLGTLRRRAAVRVPL